MNLSELPYKGLNQVEIKVDLDTKEPQKLFEKKDDSQLKAMLKKRDGILSNKIIAKSHF